MKHWGRAAVSVTFLQKWGMRVCCKETVTQLEWAILSDPFKCSRSLEQTVHPLRDSASESSLWRRTAHSFSAGSHEITQDNLGKLSKDYSEEQEQEGEKWGWASLSPIRLLLSIASGQMFQSNLQEGLNIHNIEKAKSATNMSHLSRKKKTKKAINVVSTICWYSTFKVFMFFGLSKWSIDSTNPSE